MIRPFQTDLTGSLCGFQCFITCTFILITFGCDSFQDQSPPLLFRCLSSEESGINFANPIPESTYMNGLFYEYYYNGSGVAAGDFNNDGLVDIFFVSTIKEHKLYINRGHMKFEDATSFSNLKSKAAFRTGVTTVDINNDGWLDIYICASGRIQDPGRRRNELYINQGLDNNGYPRFKEDAISYNLDLPHFSTQASFFDYDRDGDLDMFIINHGIDVYGKSDVAHFRKMEDELGGEKLYRNDNGKFTDTTKELGIISNKLSFGLGLAIGDINNDGWPDIYVSHDFYGKDHCYINNKGKGFVEQINNTMNHIPNFSMGNDMADFNNDGLMDIISVDMMAEDNYGIKTSMSAMEPKTFHDMVLLGEHHQYMFNTIQLNNGVTENMVPKFSDIAQLLGASSTDWSWGPLFFDMDNDGHKDLFISNGIKRDFRNNDFIEYTRKLRDSLSRNKSIDKELYVQKIMSRIPTRYKPNYFFRNNGDLTFDKMNGIWDKQRLTCSNGAAYADFDNDGDLDLVLNNTDSLSYVQENRVNDVYKNNYLKMIFKGSEGNTMGIGARVILRYENEQQVQEHYVSRGFQSSVAPGLHFGIGRTPLIDQLEVVWPDGKKQIMKEVPVNQTIRLDYRDAILMHNDNEYENEMLFTNKTNETTVIHRHTENEYNDFERESLLPHKMSNLGPALAVADVNGDSLDDFFIGGAMGYAGALYIQSEKGGFMAVQHQLFEEEKRYEDVGAEFFDADGDGDMDLYVVSGGNERAMGSDNYQDRLYENKRGNLVRSMQALPAFDISGSCVKSYDFDHDGDLDIFVGGGQMPGRYPFPTASYLLENRSAKGKLSFINVTSTMAPMLEKIGMVTDAVWMDVDNDSLIDLVVVGEWMAVTILKNMGGYFVDKTNEFGLSNEKGWWYSIAVADFDQDGDLDLVAGNLGLNYKYKASVNEPFEIYTADFDENGSLDIVLGYHNEGTLFPLRGRECTSNQMPFVKDKFATYDAFGKATLSEVYGKESLQRSLHYRANTFATKYFENAEGKKLIPRPLDMLTQLSSVNTILVEDLNRDGHLDIVLAGNKYGAEVETPRNDASYGVFLKGDGLGAFTSLMPYESGLFAGGNIRKSSFLKLANGERGIIFALNDDFVKIVGLQN